MAYAVVFAATARRDLTALPEKVAADGSPAGPAPLAWTCSLLLLALCESDRGR